MKILLIISAILLFGFWGYCWIRFGIHDCLSRFSKQCYPIWSYVLVISALLLVPIMIELSDGKMLQFAGFLAPVSLVLVGCTPDWATSQYEYILHNVGVGLAVVFSVIYTLLFPGLVWFILIAGVLAGILGLAFKKYWLWFAELAIYSAMYAEITYLLFQ